CHGYRGVFGAHVAQVLRRLRRVCARYGADPVFVLASATVAEPGVAATRLTGVEVDVVDEDGSPRGSTDFVLYEPPLLLTSPAGQATRDLPAQGRQVPAEAAVAAATAARRDAARDAAESGPAGENGAPVRRSATAESADLLADLVADGVRTLVFVRSRRAAEVVANSARRALGLV